MKVDKVIDIVLIDDHILFSEGDKRILEFEPAFNVVGEGGDGDEATQLVEEHQPDVVLMDINMPNINGVQATADLVRKYPDINIIILSIHDVESDVTHALKTSTKG